MLEFIFGKDEIIIDTLSLMIKNYIYKLRKEDKHFSDKLFPYKVDLRFKADMTENNKDKFKYLHQWSIFRDMTTQFN